MQVRIGINREEMEKTKLETTIKLEDCYTILKLAKYGKAFRTCVVCEKKFKITHPGKNLRQTCSEQCRKIGCNGAIKIRLGVRFKIFKIFGFSCVYCGAKGLWLFNRSWL